MHRVEAQSSWIGSGASGICLSSLQCTNLCWKFVYQYLVENLKSTSDGCDASVKVAEKRIGREGKGRDEYGKEKKGRGENEGKEIKKNVRRR